ALELPDLGRMRAHHGPDPLHRASRVRPRRHERGEAIRGLQLALDEGRVLADAMRDHLRRAAAEARPCLLRRPLDEIVDCAKGRRRRALLRLPGLAARFRGHRAPSAWHPRREVFSASPDSSRGTPYGSTGYRPLEGTESIEAPGTARTIGGS